MTTEIRMAEIARNVVSDNGGRMNYSDYDQAIKEILIAPPLHWPLDAPALAHTNNGVRCAHAAIKHGLLRQDENAYFLGPEGA